VMDCRRQWHNNATRRRRYSSHVLCQPIARSHTVSTTTTISYRH